MSSNLAAMQNGEGNLSCELKFMTYDKIKHVKIESGTVYM